MVIIPTPPINKESAQARDLCGGLAKSGNKKPHQNKIKGGASYGRKEHFN